jgi:phosphatidate cytidylyltransferase
MLGTLLVGGASGMVFLVLLFALGAQWELLSLLRRFELGTLRRQVYLWTAAIPLGAWLLRPIHAGIYLSLLALLCLPIHGILHLPPARLPRTLAPSLFAILYIPLPLHFAILLLRAESGICLLAWVVAVVKLGDIGGLLVGMRWGNHALSPAYSPSKTWEGFWGGLAFSAAAGPLLWLLARWFGAAIFPLWLSLPLSILLAARGTGSDLLESALKRLAGEKDSGGLIPGIGGFLDFCDSLILSLPTAYFALQLSGVLR